MEKMMNVKPYDMDVIEELTGVLLWKDMVNREDGLMDIPSATIQLGINILESAKYYVSDLTLNIEKRCEFRKSLNDAIRIMANLRDKQKIAEMNRRSNT